MSTTTHSGVLGNPVNYHAVDVVSPDLYRREMQKAQVKFTFSRYTEAYGGKMVDLPMCGEEKGVTYPLQVTLDFLLHLRDGQGGRIDRGQWVQQVSKPNSDYLPNGCYKKADGPRTINGVELKPFTSVITDRYPVGTKLLIPDLDKIKMENNEFHNGCVEVMDNSLDDDDLHLYIVEPGRQELFPKVMKKKKIDVEVHANCTIKNYSLKP